MTDYDYWKLANFIVHTDLPTLSKTDGLNFLYTLHSLAIKLHSLTIKQEKTVYDLHPPTVWPNRIDDLISAYRLRWEHELQQELTADYTINYDDLARIPSFFTSKEAR